MVLKELKLNNFRNFPKRTVKFAPGASLLFGENGSGKSNLLEAIYLLATGSSLRAQSETELIAEGSPVATILGRVGSDELPPVQTLPPLPFGGHSRRPGELLLEISLARSALPTTVKALVQRRFKVNGVARRRRDFAGKLRAVLFNPESLGLVTDPPSYRRNYLNLVLSQSSDGYLLALGLYNKAVLNRNRLLYQIDNGFAKITELDYWEGVICQNSTIVCDGRSSLITKINAYLRANYSKFMPEASFGINYTPNRLSPDKFNEYREREIRAGRTLIGPHRDDFRIIKTQIDTDKETDLHRYGSRGEQRLAVFALKIAEWFYLEKLGGKPVLLLDDIFSELDDRHREIVFGSLGFGQVITSTAEKQLAESFTGRATLINLQ